MGCENSWLWNALLANVIFRQAVHGILACTDADSMVHHEGTRRAGSEMERISSSPNL